MTDTEHPAISAINALLAEREKCRARVDEINGELQKIRESIDLRTAPAPRRLRAVKTTDVGDTTEPPEAA